MEPSGIGKLMIGAGFLLIVIGAIFLLSDRLPFLKALGRLPGDLSWQGEGWRVHVPLMTSLILSVVLSLVFWLISWLSNRGGR